jgi:MoCo/4Fe-4S cofactor protein with predicted Tat translocation signal
MSNTTRKTLGPDLAAVRARLGAGGESAPGPWRSLEELAGTEEFARMVGREFPELASEFADPVGRRDVLRLMGASLALGGVGVSGCDYSHEPPSKILPYVRQPENLVQGKSLRYASAISVGGVGTGVVVESHMGRPTMVAGNELHPDSLGAIDPLTQASLLNLYDPDRSKVVMRGTRISTFDAFLLAMTSALDAQRPKRGAGLRVLTETVTSPTLARQVRALLKEFPGAKWHQYEPAAPHSRRAGLKLAFGRDLSARHKVENADVIVCLDADFLSGQCGTLAEARGFALRREPPAGGHGHGTPRGMNRLYAVEPTMTVTGSMADHRLPLKARDVLPFAAALARRVGVSGVPALPASAAAVETTHADFLNAVAKDLSAHKGASLVLAGPNQPAYAHALAAAMNHALGNAGKTVEYAPPVEAEPVDQLASLAELCTAMAGGSVDVLLVLGGNPAYTAPADSGFAAAVKRVKFAARLGPFEDETSSLCHWHLPESHELEAWGDVLGSDGTATIQQPMIAPLYPACRSASELIAALLRHPTGSGYELVRETWKGRTPEGRDFEAFWATSVHAGVVEGSAPAAVSVEPKSDLGPPPFAAADAGGSAAADEIVFRPDPTVWDGRFANNAWLQELPKPLTKLTWDNAALMSLATAEKLGVTSGDVVELSYRGRKVEAPVFVLPGHAHGSVTVHFGYGRPRVGRVGRGAGFNAFALWTADAPGFGAGLTVRPTGATHRLAVTQSHRTLEKSRNIVHGGTLAEWEKDPGFVHHRGSAHEVPSKDETLYHDDFSPTNPIEPDYQWGMVVNLNACTGCSACTLACVAENNIPVVGKEQVLNSREMHWLEVDQYFDGDPANPGVYNQPRLCMHCEKAPCEVVCPVAATVHDHEGLNVMVYNRCVGTRYCSNNCPYKVRHFNFFQYQPLSDDPDHALASLHNNPDVTVRARGVMEKCTYCVQRINESRYTAEREGRRLRDGEVVTACQSACPTRAIVFGDVSDKNSAVSKLKADPRNYSMLAELNTRPRTTYLAKLRNPNPEIGTEAGHGV